MSNGQPLITALFGLNQRVMCEVVPELDKLTVTELHNLISKTNVLRALVSLALQDKKFPIPE